MDEDDSGYERSTVTTSNSIFQTDLHELIYQNLNNNNLDNRPVNHYSNYESNYSSESLIIQTLQPNELRSPRSLNSSGLIASRPESSAYSTISSCSLNRQFNQQIDQDYPRLEEYQPLDQFRTIDNYHLLQEQQNFQQTSDMSTSRSNTNFQRNKRASSSPDYEHYEQDWSAGEQDDDSDYIVDHVRQVKLKDIEFSNASSSNLNKDRHYRRLLINDLEQNDNDIEEFNEGNEDFLCEKDEEEEDLDNLDDDNSEENINILVKDKKSSQLVDILNSPLDHSPFLTSPSLSLPSSSDSSPCLSSKHYKQKTKIKLPDSFSESSLESPKSLESSPRSVQSFTTDHNKQPTSPKSVDSNLNRIRKSIIENNNQPQPISEEEFTSRKIALRERINNTFRILNNINNNCNRFRTITSRSKELLNQRRQAELEIDNIVQQNSNLNSNITNNNLRKQPPSELFERDLINSTIDCESNMNKTQDKKQEVFDTKHKDEDTNIEKLFTDSMDKTQNVQPTGDTLNNLNELSKTIEFSKPPNLTSTSNSSRSKIHKDTMPIDHFNSSTALNLANESPTPRTKPPIPQDFKSNTNLTKPTIDKSDSYSENSSKCALAKTNESKSIRDYNNQLLSVKNNAGKKRSSSIADLVTTSASELSENSKLKLSAISNSDTEQMKRSNDLNDKIVPKSSSSLKLSSKSDNSGKSDKSISLSPRSSKNESRFSTLKSAKIRNNLKSSLNDIKSELSDLSDLLNITTTTSSLSLDQVSKNNTDNNLMSFVMQPKLVNTEIDSRLMDHILSKICAQREKELKESSLAAANIPSTSQASNADRPTTSTNKQQTKNQTKKRLPNDEKTESKHCQTDKIKNQDVSVSVNERDLESENAKKLINDKKKEKKLESRIKEIKDGSKEEKDDKKDNCKICEDCKKKYHLKNESNDCEKKETDNLESDRNESLDHCCIKRTQNAHRSSCASIFHHLPVCINTCTFNHNTFTSSLPNLLHHSPISVLIEQGTNTEPDNANESDQKTESSNKRDKQTQCILGLSLEQQQREYIENQQQKYAKLKSELSKQNEFSRKRNENIDIVKKVSNDNFDKIEKEKIGNKDDEKFEKVDKIERQKEREDVVEKEHHKREIADTKEDTKKDKEVIKNKPDDKKTEIFSASDDKEDDEKTLKPEQDSIPIETTTTKSTDSSDSYEKKEIDLTLPIKLPFESHTSKLERKLLDASKEKNVKTHSKIIIEFSGKSKRERSAVDSFTKLDKEGRLTKKTLVSNTKEYLINPKESESTSANNNNSTTYPLSSTPKIESNHLAEQNSITFYKNRNENQRVNSDQEWKEASHSEITNEMYADPLLNENNEAHPTKSITLSTTTTFDQTAQDQPQRIDHSNKYQRCFENPSIYEPLIQSNFTMIDEPQIMNRSNLDDENIEEENLSNANSSDENQVESEIKSENEEIYSSNETKEKDDKINQANDKISNFNQDEFERGDYRTSSVESRSSESRLSNTTPAQYKPNDYRNYEQEANVNSRSASRVSFNLPYNYKESVDEESSNNQANNMYLDNSMESNLDQIDNFDPNKASTSKPTITDLDSHQPAGLLETELDDHLFYENNNNQNSSQQGPNYDETIGQEREKERKSKRTSKSSSSKSKSKDKKSKSSSSKRKHQTSEPVSDQSSLYSTANSQHRLTPKLNDSGFLSPEIYHSSPYDIAYQQVNDKKDKKQPKSDKKKSSSSKLEKKCKSKNLLKQNNDLKFTEHKSNTEIITHLTKTSYPSNYQIDLNKLTTDSQKQIEKSLKNLKRNKMVLDQILNSPDFKPSSGKRSSQDKKKRSNCKISSQITMDLPIYKEERLEKLEKTISRPLKSVSLEELDKERDLDHKSIVSQHSYSQQSGELFNTMTKFQRYKPSLSKSSKKNKSAIHLNQPDQWEYSMQCNCTNGPKANVL